jgi:EmrB/QacA subfamily drug resistance transporter
MVSRPVPVAPRPAPTGGMDSRTGSSAALALLCAATFIIGVEASIVFVAIPSMSADIGLSAQSVQWVLSSYLLAFGGLLLLGGRMADLLGRRRMLIVGAALLAVSGLLCGLAWNGGVLIAARLLQGLSAAIMVPTALSVLTTSFPEGQRRNRALGIWSAASGAGGTVGALSGGPLVDGWGWSWIFFVSVPVAALVALLAPMVLTESRGHTQVRTFDLAGALTSTAALVLVVYAVSEAPASGWTGTDTLWQLGLAAALLVAFVVVETRSAAPLVPLRLFRAPALVGGNLLMLFVGMTSHGAMGFLTTQYAQVVLGYSAVEYGVMFAGMTLLTIVGSMIAGSRTATRFGARPVAFVSLVLIGLGCLAFTQISVGGSFVGDIALGMAVFAPGIGGGFVAGSIASLGGVRERDAGLASGLNNASFTIGGALGIAILATVVATTVADQQDAEPLVALTDGFATAYGVAIVFAALGVATALALFGRRPSGLSVPNQEER